MPVRRVVPNLQCDALEENRTFYGLLGMEEVMNQGWVLDSLYTPRANPLTWAPSLKWRGSSMPRGDPHGRPPPSRVRPRQA